jgi:hypothetical protein
LQLNPLTGSPIANTIIRGAINNAVSQGMSIALGLQDDFNWKAVAAAGLGSVVGQQIGDGLEKAGAFKELGDFGADFVRKSVTGLSSGVATSLARSGRVSLGRVAADAFGNALGEGLMNQSQPALTQGMGPWSDIGYRNGLDIESDNAGFATGQARAASLLRDIDDLVNGPSPYTDYRTMFAEASGKAHPVTLMRRTTAIDVSGKGDTPEDWSTNQEVEYSERQKLGRGAANLWSRANNTYAGPRDTELRGGFFDEGADSEPIYPEPKNSQIERFIGAISRDPRSEILSGVKAVGNWGVGILESYMKSAAISQALSPQMSMAAAVSANVATNQEILLENIPSVSLSKFEYSSPDGMGPFVEGSLEFGFFARGAFDLFRATGSFSSISRLPSQTYLADEWRQVTAWGEIGELTWMDTNQTMRALERLNENYATLIKSRVDARSALYKKAFPNGNMATAHAEVGVIQQAFDAGKTQGADMVITVLGRDVCGHCIGDLAEAAKNAGLKSLKINATRDVTGKPVTYFWTPGMKSLKPMKSAAGG